jgi:hypothetical protein
MVAPAGAMAPEPGRRDYAGVYATPAFATPAGGRSFAPATTAMLTGTVDLSDGRTTMSVLRTGDEEMHYCDSSHRWVAPADMEQGAWTAGVRLHLEQHRATMGGPIDDDVPGCVAVRIPRQRRR